MSLLKFYKIEKLIFSSLTFLFYFLPLLLLIYFSIGRGIALKNFILLVASLLFYAWGEQHYLVILLLSILVNYSFGILIDSMQSRLFFLLGLLFNILLLIFWKYIGFFTSNILYLFPTLDTSILSSLQTIHLPLGISFFTFQGISYLFDVYKKDVSSEKNIVNLALYISMFPQLVAGPIVRFKTIAKALKDRVHSWELFHQGVLLFVIGMGYKVLIANILAKPADEIFALTVTDLSTALAWVGIIAYTLQIYFDFCGYSIMAVGLGLLFGFKLPANFKYPYTAQSITEFWRRWHITLSEWFRDYLYIPLGGNRRGSFVTYRNLLLVFFLCGIWHGAAWTFLCWGLYQGFFLIVERIGLLNLLKKTNMVFRHLYTMFIVILGWVVFKASDFNHANYYYKALFGLGPSTDNSFLLYGYINPDILTAFCLGLLLATPLIRNIFFASANWETLVELDRTPRVQFPIFYYSFLLIVLLFSIARLTNETYNPFIYFQF